MTKLPCSTDNIITASNPMTRSAVFMHSMTFRDCGRVMSSCGAGKGDVGAAAAILRALRICE